MFQKTVSFWRRLLGSVPHSDCSTQVAEERRRSVRYSTNQTLRYRLTSAPDANSPPLTAQLRNVSAGGISLLSDQEFTPGDLLSIEVPGGREDTPTAVLACVVHVNQQTDSQWSIGCTFSSPLAAEELQGFDTTEGSSPSEVEEQRTTPRYYCQIEAHYQLIADEPEENRPARVLNISTTGIGLAVDQQIAVGKLLNVELHSIGKNNFKNLLCCAVHVTKQPQGEWLIGCNFITEMEEGELNLFLKD